MYLREKNRKYKSVLIDGLTEIQRKLSMGEILGELESDDSYNDLAARKPADRYDWLTSGEQMRKLVRAFRDLAYHPDVERRIHVIMTASEKSDEDRNIVCPSLPGKVGMEIGGSVDVLARLSVERVQVGDAGEEKELRRLLLHESVEDGTKILAKVRAPEELGFPREIWKPTVAKLVGQWVKLSAKLGKEAE